MNFKYETGTIKFKKSGPIKSNVIETEDESAALEAFNCGRDYLLRSHNENGIRYVEEWDPEYQTWEAPCSGCAVANTCTEKDTATCCSEYIEQGEIKSLRKFKNEQERKRSAGLLLELPMPLHTPILKIVSKMVGGGYWEPALETGQFSLADYFEVGKTVFPTTQRVEANKALACERERLKEHNRRVKESIDFEDAFRRKRKKK